MTHLLALPGKIATPQPALAAPSSREEMHLRADRATEATVPAVRQRARRSGWAASEREERRWIRAAQQGSEEALERLYRQHWPWAHRAAFLVVHDAAAAEDTAQESFLAAVRALERFDRRRRKRRRDIPRLRAFSSHATQARRIASRSTGRSAGGTNSPFEHGPNLIGSPGSSDGRATTRIRGRALVRSPVSPLHARFLAARGGYPGRRAKLGN